MNRHDFVNATPADARVITAPHMVKFKILEMKDFEYSVFIPGGPWGNSDNRKDTITKYRIKIYNGELHYPNRKIPFTSATPEDIWVGKKWIDKRLRDRETRLEKRRSRVK